MMKLSEYFEKNKGKGVIATSDAKGKVGMAVYARPHFVSDKTVAFIMADRLMHKNLESNPNAAYLFMEEGNRYAGKRLYLTKLKEEKNSDLIEQIRRKDACPVDEGYKRGLRYLVYFKVNKVLPLIGAK
ncbi:MAG TPA: pyridoxamine 5'-phosphate oxidase family protein [Thermodesulfobacteriota bacterium]|nr:pyridoxamine 5'-phosphate oxidase family protein [Thermodesulfobacteriota bacterium]